MACHDSASPLFLRVSQQGQGVKTAPIKPDVPKTSIIPRTATKSASIQLDEAVPALNLTTLTIRNIRARILHKLRSRLFPHSKPHSQITSADTEAPWPSGTIVIFVPPAAGRRNDRRRHVPNSSIARITHPSLIVDRVSVAVLHDLNRAVALGIETRADVERAVIRVWCRRLLR